jgi:phosphoenolpyruvate phosphomutase
MGDTPAVPGTRLRLALKRPAPALLLEAHNAVSARIASEAGADALWASSLTLSCSFGYPDDESLPLDQAVDMVEAIVASSAVPVLFDGDTGGCCAREVTTVVRALCRVGAAGVAFEDKSAPKLNSLVPGGGHRLASIEEFARRIDEARAAQTNAGFVVVARTEALIAGLGLAEALRRAEAYADAGADAVLVHSKAPTFDEVARFLRGWSRKVPVLCVPTTYAATPPEAFATAGVSGVIWANQLMRAAVDAMQRTARDIVRARNAAGVEQQIAPVPELWRLQQISLPREVA